jgi:hypothetical protein
LIASHRSRNLPEEACKQKQQPLKPEIDGALAYIQSHPAPLEGPNLEEVAARLAQAIQIGNGRGNEKPRFNEDGDKALVRVTFQAGDDVLLYEASFYRTGDVWRPRGVFEQAQLYIVGSPRARP